MRDLQRAIFTFPVCNAVLAIFFLAVPLVAGRFWIAQTPELQIMNEQASEEPLGDRLFKTTRVGENCPELGPDEPRIALAASGGGTRAALYTASVLRGLAEERQICRLVLASGVSGGSAALAYLAAHQDELIVPGAPDPDAWKSFQEAMARPYIQDVLYLAADNASVFGTWRPRAGVCDEDPPTPDERRGALLPQRIGLGNLLAESFTCHLGQQKMGAANFGLIFNAAMLGEFNPKPRDNDQPLPEQAREKKGRSIRSAEAAGGRLIFTNFKVDRSKRGALYVSLTDKTIPVARAAALSANFPPVFADAAIDIVNKGTDRRFWVTDGGAVENRGTVTLYMAVADAFPKKPVPRWPAWPDLHVIVADASAVGRPYQEGVGFGAVTGAGGKLGLALEEEQCRDLEVAYRQYGSTLAVHELPMPAVLRDAIGTHWMMPKDVKAKGWRDKELWLSREQVLTLARTLFTDAAGEPDEKIRLASAWTRYDVPEDGGPFTPSPHRRGWQELLSALSPLPEMPPEAADGWEMSSGTSPAAN